jgi:hypothetical protein
MANARVAGTRCLPLRGDFKQHLLYQEAFALGTIVPASYQSHQSVRIARRRSAGAHLFFEVAA